jgi:hypothetical protein
VNGVNHRYAGRTLEVTDHNVDRIGKRLNYITYGILIDLGGQDN